jgi:cation/acetate symporter
MHYSASAIAIAIFSCLVGLVLGLSFYLGRKAKSAKGYYAAHGQIHWFVNGVAFAGDYLSAASFLGICGLIAFYGFDGFLYSIGFLAGWVVALFVIAEPIKRLGKFTFADALDSQFHSRGIKLAAAISTLVVSVFYLIPQMVGAGTLIQPLLGMPYWGGVVGVGLIVTIIVVTAGMVSTTWVQFIKGSLLVIFCGLMTIMILNRGVSTTPAGKEFHEPRRISLLNAAYLQEHGWTLLPETGGFAGKDYVRVKDDQGLITIWRKIKTAGWTGIDTPVVETQYIANTPQKPSIINGREKWSRLPDGTIADFYPVGNVAKLPGDKTGSTGPLGPLNYLATLQQSTMYSWKSEAVKDGATTYTIYYPELIAGSSLMVPGRSPTFAGIRKEGIAPKLDLISLMLALFCGTAALPHILIRYYTVKDQKSARKSTVVGIAAIGLFYILTLYLGLGAMTSGILDPTNNTMSAPLLARSFGEVMFACISAIAFTTVLGTVSGLIIAASGAIAHDLLHNFMKMDLDDHGKVRAGKIASFVVGLIAIGLGILFEKMNPSFLVGWAFNIAASANLPAIVMLLFWKGTTKQGITASIIVGLLSSLAWILLTNDAFKYIYGIDTAAHPSPMPFSQPGLVTIPLSFITLIVVSIATGHAKNRAKVMPAQTHA